MDKEQKAIERIRLASEMSLQYYGLPLVCTYSGGKDSDVLLELFKRSGVPFEVHNSHTTVDAPQTVYHIRNRFKYLEEAGIRCKIEMPKYKGKRCSMWTLIPDKKTPPLRIKRYCCAILKEMGGHDRYIATGVRWAESAKRKEWGSFSQPNRRIHASDEIMMNSDNDIRRKMMEHCVQKSKMVVNPIIDWSNADIWDFINQEHICTNPLYQCGYDRIGCIGCPMAGRHRWKEFADFPTYKRAYIRAFDKMLEERMARGKANRWKNGYEVFLWWMEDDNVNGQMDFGDFPELLPEGMEWN